MASFTVRLGESYTDLLGEKTLTVALCSLSEKWSVMQYIAFFSDKQFFGYMYIFVGKVCIPEGDTHEKIFIALPGGSKA